MYTKLARELVRAILSFSLFLHSKVNKTAIRQIKMKTKLTISERHPCRICKSFQHTTVLKLYCTRIPCLSEVHPTILK